MTRAREQLIQELAADLEPRRRLAPAGAAALLWFGACLAFVLLATRAAGPLRPGVLHQLVSEPEVWLDVLLGAVAAAAAISGLTRLRIPGLASGLRAAAPALVLLLAWLAFHALAVPGRVTPPSTLGGRAFCWLQVLLFALPPLAAALYLARRAAPLEPGWTGLLAGLAAGALAALAMQLGCMHDPLHALVAHLAPALVVTGLGAWLGRRLLHPL